MLLYVVEPPPTEDAGEGEDTREWFARKEDAIRRFKALKRIGQEYIRLDRKMREAKTDEQRNTWRERRYDADPGWVFLRITLRECEINVRTRDTLAAALRGRLRRQEKVLATWAPEDS